MTSLLSAALNYAAHGWLVFPCKPKSKYPATQHGFKDATTDRAQICQWWRENPDYNVAIRTGKDSGVFVLDIDQKLGHNPDETVLDLPKMPDTPTVRTGGGGLQFFFKYPENETLSITGGKLAVNIDTRGEGGYVVAPPSIHDRTGNEYQWIDCDETTKLADCPQWLIDKLQKQKTESAKMESGAKKLKGGRHQTLVTAAALMRGSGFAVPEIKAALHAMIARLDLSDGRVISETEINNIAEWTADKKEGKLNIEAVMQGNEIANELLKNMGEAADEITPDAITAQDPGKFPEELLNVPGVVNLWTDYINRTSLRAQQELALAATLAACGAIIGKRAQTEYRGRANVYFMGLCETGGGKERARQAVKEILNATKNDNLIGPEDLASESGLISSIVNQNVLLYQIDEFGKLLEAIRNPRASAHLSGIISSLLKLYSSANTIFKGKAYGDVKKNPVIDQPHACLYATATPEATWQAMGESAVDDGLLARMFVVSAPDQKPKRRNPENINPPQELIDLIIAWNNSEGSAINSIYRTSPVIKATPEARDIYNDLAEECDELEKKMRDNPLRKLWTRTAQKAEQLGMIHAWSRDPLAVAKLEQSPDAANITAEDALWAAKLSTYLTKSAIYNGSKFIASTKIESDIQKMQRFIEAGKENGRTKSELYIKFRGLGHRGIEEAMTMLKEGGTVVGQVRETKGRSAIVAVSVKYAKKEQGDDL